MYDWANSAFATTVMAGFFPVFFSQYWSAGADATITTARLGIGNSIAGFLVAVMAPLLGAIADKGSSRKRFLVFFAYAGVIMTLALYFVSMGAWKAAIALYVLASIGFSGSLIFYDALIKSVVPPRATDRVSALGYGLGYLGGGLLFAVNVWMTLRPGAFGLAGPADAVRFSFLTVGIWWGLFTIPLILFVREEKAGKVDSGVVSAGFRELAGTFREIRALRPVLLFLAAYWFYIDGVDTIVRMAVDYGLSIGLQRNDLIAALLVTQFVGFPSALAFGWIGAKTGTTRAIFAAIGIYFAVSILAAFIHDRREFFALAVTIGLVQGGVQALSRSCFSRMIPEGKSAEYFGFYNMIGKSAAVMGPLLVGTAGLLARSAGLSAGASARAGISSISLLFVAGGIFLFMAGRSGPRDRRAPADEKEPLS
jgi:UMF1 family MFS transporter